MVQQDEVALEFPYSLQSGNGPERVLSQFRSRNLLLIGCNLPEGINRFFLRLSNVERLYSDHRAKKEFLVRQVMADVRDFNTFLQRFSQDSRLYPIRAAEFVDELYRWSEPPLPVLPLAGRRRSIPSIPLMCV